MGKINCILLNLHYDYSMKLKCNDINGLHILIALLQDSMLCLDWIINDTNNNILSISINRIGWEFNILHRVKSQLIIHDVINIYTNINTKNNLILFSIDYIIYEKNILKIHLSYGFIIYISIKNINIYLSNISEYVFLNSTPRFCKYILYSKDKYNEL